MTHLGNQLNHALLLGDNFLQLPTQCPTDLFPAVLQINCGNQVNLHKQIDNTNNRITSEMCRKLFNKIYNNELSTLNASPALG